MITKDMLVWQVLQQHPRARDILARHGMGCNQCMGAMQETVEEAARMHGLDLQALLADLNGRGRGKRWR